MATKIKFKLNSTPAAPAAPTPSATVTAPSVSPPAFAIPAPLALNTPSNPVVPKKSGSDQPVKLKAKIKLASSGYYDSDDDESAMPVEEHLILRLPKDDPIATSFRQLVKTRQEMPADTDISWKGKISLDDPCLIRKITAAVY